MLAIIATVVFAAAYMLHGGVIADHTRWLDATGMMLLGLALLAAHAAKR